MTFTIPSVGKLNGVLRWKIVFPAIILRKHNSTLYTDFVLEDKSSGFIYRKYIECF